MDGPETWLGQFTHPGPIMTCSKPCMTNGPGITTSSPGPALILNSLTRQAICDTG